MLTTQKKLYANIKIKKKMKNENNLLRQSN